MYAFNVAGVYFICNACAWKAAITIFDPNGDFLVCETWVRPNGDYENCQPFYCSPGVISALRANMSGAAYQWKVVGDDGGGGRLESGVLTITVE